MVAQARQLAALGLPLQSVAAGVGIARGTLHRWMRNPTDDLERAMGDAIHAGRSEGQQKLVAALHQAAANGDVRAITWALSHSPQWRDHWSDAGADRKAVAQAMAKVVYALDAAPLTPDQRLAVLLQLQAQGITTDGVDTDAND
jgi:hypothetical protein